MSSLLLSQLTHYSHPQLDHAEIERLSRTGCIPSLVSTRIFDHRMLIDAGVSRLVWSRQRLLKIHLIKIRGYQSSEDSHVVQIGERGLRRLVELVIGKQSPQLAASFVIEQEPPCKSRSRPPIRADAPSHHDPNAMTKQMLTEQTQNPKCQQQPRLDVWQARLRVRMRPSQRSSRSRGSIEFWRAQMETHFTVSTVHRRA